VSFRLTTINGRNGVASREMTTFAKQITNDLQNENRTFKVDNYDLFFSKIINTGSMLRFWKYGERSVA
jgi:hypothetical protein